MEIAVPLEFLDIPPGQAFRSTLNAKAASTMIAKTKLHPRRRMEEVENGFKVRFPFCDLTGTCCVLPSHMNYLQTPPFFFLFLLGSSL